MPGLDEILLEKLLEARSVLVLTGAGMSAESGIRTFREAQTGLWAQYRPEELATPEAFREHPARVWRWYEERRAGVRQARPHAGHRALVELAALLPVAVPRWRWRTGAQFPVTGDVTIDPISVSRVLRDLVCGRKRKGS